MASTRSIRSFLYNELYFVPELADLVSEYVEPKIDCKCIAKLKGRCTTLSDGRILFSKDKILHIFNPKKGTTFEFFNSNMFEDGIGLLRNNGDIVLASTQIGLWSQNTCVIKHTHSQKINFLYEMKDGLIVAVSGNCVMFLNLENDEKKFLNIYILYSAFFAEINRKIYTILLDGNLAEITPQGTYSRVYTRKFLDLCVLNERYILITHEKNNTIIWNPQTGRYINKLNNQGRFMGKLSKGRIMTSETDLWQPVTRCNVWDPLKGRPPFAMYDCDLGSFATEMYDGSIVIVGPNGKNMTIYHEDNTTKINSGLDVKVESLKAYGGDIFMSTSTETYIFELDGTMKIIRGGNLTRLSEGCFSTTCGNETYIWK